MRKALLFVCALLFLCAHSAGASPGGTDANGGHRDSKTGEYHYHHGYPAHQHIDGLCPCDPGYTSPATTAGDSTRSSNPPAAEGSSEDADDDVVAGYEEKTAPPFQGIPKRDQTGLTASGVALAFIALGGLLSTVKRSPKD